MKKRKNRKQGSETDKKIFNEEYSAEKQSTETQESAVEQSAEDSGETQEVISAETKTAEDKKTLQETLEISGEAQKEIFSNSIKTPENPEFAELEKEAPVELQRIDMTTDFTEFIRDFFGRLIKWLKLNQRMIFTALALCVGVVFVIWIAVIVSRRTDAARLAASVSENLQLDLTENNGAIPVPQEALQMNAYPAVNELVNRYFEAMQNNDIDTLATINNYMDAVETAKINAKYNYIESYENIVCYTKIGPIQNSYLAYVCYDVKMRNWDVLAPSLLTLFICTDYDGSLYIYTGDFDDHIANYIASISSQADVLDLITRVSTEYHEIMDSNEDFAAYMSTLKPIIKDEVSQQLAASGYVVVNDEADDNVSSNAAEAQESEEVVSENNAEETSEEPESFEVQAITTVNVRASDSELADRLGKVAAGTVLTCNVQQENGWSEVVYEDQVGYIKTEYLLAVGEGADETQANGTVTVSETVNVRGTADIDGEKLGVAYAGESFPLIGDTEGEWTHIIYNGQNGFIKTEFVID